MSFVDQRSNPEPCRIEPARTEDTSSIVDLLIAQMREFDFQVSRNAVQQVVQNVIADPRSGLILLAIDAANNHLVGVAYAATIQSVEHGGVVGWLEELYVRPEARGCGIGGRLVHGVTSRALQFGWRAVELETISGSERAASLYIRQGFVTLGRTRFCNKTPFLK